MFPNVYFLGNAFNMMTMLGEKEIELKKTFLLESLIELAKLKG